MKHITHDTRLSTWPIILLIVGALVSGGPAPVESAPSRLLLGPEYPTAALEMVQRATTTVDLAIYFIILNPDRADDPVAPLVEALVGATRRGVQVTVVVDDSKRSENALAVARLRQGGVAVRTDSPAVLLHAKALVVDERWVLVGSANWSRAAFTANAEAAVLVDDPGTARPLAAAIRRWAAEGAAEDSVAGPIPAIEIPTAWVRAGGPLSRLVERRADLAFHVVLALARDGTRPDPRDPAVWAPYWRELGVTRPRTQRKVRTELAAVALDAPPASVSAGQRAVARQVPLAAATSAPPWADTIALPATFWTYGDARRLSTRAQLLYLVALAEAARSTRAPCWFRSQRDLAAATGLSDVTVGLALLELERVQLLTVTRDPPRPPVFAARDANQYCVAPLVEFSRRPTPAEPARFDVDMVPERAIMRSRRDAREE